MEFDWEKFLTAYQEADKETKELIDSGIIADFVQNEFAKDSLSSKNRQIVMVALSHYILKATPENEIVEILVTHGVKNVSRLLNDFNPSYTKSIPPNLSTMPPAPQNLSSEISETEKELASLQTVRTMSHDMAAIKPGSDVVYQSSSQADILRTPDVDELPNVASATPQTTRWDTDTH